jgi:hypothetical protein
MLTRLQQSPNRRLIRSRQALGFNYHGGQKAFVKWVKDYNPELRLGVVAYNGYETNRTLPTAKHAHFLSALMGCSVRKLFPSLAKGWVAGDAYLHGDRVSLNNVPEHELVFREDVVIKVEREQLVAFVEKALRQAPREARVIDLYFGLRGEKPLSLEEVGDLLTVTRERVRQLRERGLRRVRQRSWGREFIPDPNCPVCDRSYCLPATCLLSRLKRAHSPNPQYRYRIA